MELRWTTMESSRLKVKERCVPTRPSSSPRGPSSLPTLPRPTRKRPTQRRVRCPQTPTCSVSWPPCMPRATWQAAPPSPLSRTFLRRPPTLLFLLLLPPRNNSLTTGRPPPPRPLTARRSPLPLVLTMATRAPPLLPTTFPHVLPPPLPPRLLLPPNLTLRLARTSATTPPRVRPRSTP
ncbi:unnamed protein product [Ectocarpus sp. 12 AP-2014]